ncbi:ABC transporter ATP-binding protein [Histidinibacterium lentulum]|uniref:ABC transporter ATP-binding protein n=1 Tax=Histidinibacterium lentulum TaxID=2480588 RepID=A0A3N2R6J7_9RHOB|nr:ABC transporter ATP-binding protein [Histidinibacterium lentulum]ROU03028.1 ABC transporter ATP-binding protein [Histidinibacterium lentulum]
MGTVELDGVGKSFGEVEVLRDIRLDIAEGEFCVLVGPSGCGKSTLLRLIAGLEEVSAGRIRIAGRDVTALESYDRGLSMVFQSYALYPHMSVRENIAFALETARLPRAEVARKVAEAARMLRLEPLLDRRPSDLSGGQRQRVAIGRSIVREPAAFLFDEPLSNLDASLRAETRIELAALHRKLGTTMIYVTHDQVEAMTLADRIVVLNAGRIEQVGPPADLYERPATEFVATFLGAPSMNLVRGAAAEAEGAETLGIRPEHLRADPSGPWTGTVAHVEYLGVDTIGYVDVGEIGRLALRLPGRAPMVPGETLTLGYDPGTLHRFRAGLRIG